MIKNHESTSRHNTADSQAAAIESQLVTRSTIHQPVLLRECVALVTDHIAHIEDERTPIIVDCTLGLAGHATAFLHAAPRAILVGIDRDEQALALATARMREEGFEQRFIPVHAPFDQLSRALADHDIDRVDAVFMDLGLSSLQIDTAERGFSYAHNAPLDMRMDTSATLKASDILQTYDVQELRSIFQRYGQEKFAGPIAKAIVKEREHTPLTTSQQLVELVDRVVPKAHRPAGNPAKRVFQALRIEVNGELDKLSQTLPQAMLHLNLHGRLVVESYHSLEDTMVKRAMAHGLHVDVPADMPVVPKDAEPFFADLTHGAMKADQEEIARNSRSGSVRLRAVELVRPIPSKWQHVFETQSQPQRQTTHNKSAYRKTKKHTTRKQVSRGEWSRA